MLVRNIYVGVHIETTLITEAHFSSVVLHNLNMKPNLISSCCPGLSFAFWPLMLEGTLHLIKVQLDQASIYRFEQN